MASSSTPASPLLYGCIAYHSTILAEHTSSAISGTSSLASIILPKIDHNTPQKVGTSGLKGTGCLQVSPRSSIILLTLSTFTSLRIPMVVYPLSRRPKRTLTTCSRPTQHPLHRRCATLSLQFRRPQRRRSHIPRSRERRLLTAHIVRLLGGDQKALPKRIRRRTNKLLLATGLRRSGVQFSAQAIDGRVRDHEGGAERCVCERAE